MEKSRSLIVDSGSGLDLGCFAHTVAAALRLLYPPSSIFHPPSSTSMPPPLRAIIFGAGFAGQGHAVALRKAGVEVVGMASRTKDVGTKVAAEANIPRYS